MELVSLFSGIGGFELAADWIGWKVISSCEINPFGLQVLKYYWPDAYHHDDVKTLNYDEIKKRLNPFKRTILVAGFPCQPFSTAGKRQGTDDERYGWPDCIKAVRELRPEWCLFENVSGLVNWNGGLVFDTVQADLEAEGYEVTPFLLPACGKNAPHKRERIWFIAYSGSNVHPGGLDNGRYRSEETGSESKDKQQGRWDENGQRLWAESGTGSETFADTYNNGSHGTQNGQSHREGNDSNKAGENPIKQFEGCSSKTAANVTTNTSNPGLQRRQFHETLNPGNRREQPSRSTTQLHQIGDWQQFPTQPPLCSGNDGLPSQLSGITFSKHRNESIKAYGNAIVPQVAFEIFKAIEAYNQQSHP